MDPGHAEQILNLIMEWIPIPSFLLSTNDGAALQQEHQSTNNFDSFTRMVQGYNTTDVSLTELLEIVSEVTAVEIIVLLLGKYVDITTIHEHTVQKIVFFALQGLVRDPPRQLHHTIYDGMRQHADDCWAVVIGKITPHYIEKVFVAFLDRLELQSGSDKLNDSQLNRVYRGLRYLNISSDRDVRNYDSTLRALLARYLDSNLSWMNTAERNHVSFMYILASSLFLTLFDPFYFYFCFTWLTFFFCYLLIQFTIRLGFRNFNCSIVSFLNLILLFSALI